MVAAIPSMGRPKKPDAHKMPQMSLRLPPPYNWFLRLISELEDRTNAAVIVRALRPNLERLGLYPLEDAAMKKLLSRTYKNIDEFKAVLSSLGLWPPPGEGNK